MRRWVVWFGLALLGLGAALGAEPPPARESKASPASSAPARSPSASALARSPSVRSAPAASARLATPAVSSPPGSAWSSREACFAALRLQPKRRTGVRIAAWNLEWFPDGVPGTKPKPSAKDLEWLACALALLDADVFAFSEVKAHPRARAALDTVLRRVGQLRGGAFRVEIDPCRPEPGQHVALAWNTARVQNEALELYGELNPHGEPCQGQLRPGFGGYFRFPGGLDLEIVGVHLKSGTEERSLDLRRRSWAALGAVTSRAEKARKDDDLVVLGDFNTMGCDGCRPRVVAKAERDELAVAHPALTLLEVTPGCSHYYHRRSGLLDLALVRRGMRELPAAARVRVAGYCAERACRSLGDDVPAARDALSDHCPIVLDLVDQDLD